MEITKKVEKLLKNKVKPAIGCTEPIAVALATARAKEEVKDKIKKVKITVSSNIYKNGMHVAIPGTSESGIAFAAALSLMAGDSNLGLEVLRNTTKEDSKQAKKIIDLITVEADDTTTKVYVKVEVFTVGQRATVIIQGAHDNITEVKVNDQVKVKNSINQQDKDNFNITDLTLRRLREEIDQISDQKLEFMLEGVEMNLAMAEIGLKEAPGLGIGKEMRRLIKRGTMKEDIINQARFMSAAAVDARMGGIKMPVMSSAGSGNHGITAIVPVAIVARNYQIDNKKLAKAIAFSHLVTVYVKEFIGVLSPVCGCSIAAGSGASAAITWLLGGSDAQIAGAIKNMIGNLTGMICDGAKYDCAFKIATSASEAIISAKLALNEKYISECNGIVNPDVETTIANLSSICIDGMQQLDKQIINAMSNC